MTTLLDRWIPVYQFNEIHATRIKAPPDRIMRSIKELPVAEISPVFRWLMEIRALPERLLGRASQEHSLAAQQPLLAQMLDGGFVMLDERPDRELVFGTIGQFWKLTGEISAHVSNPEEFAGFNDPTCGRAIANFLVGEPDGEGWRMVTTETRVQVPDAAARRKFTLYWIAIRLGSGWIRRVWLAAIKTRAEKSVATQPA